MWMPWRMRVCGIRERRATGVRFRWCGDENVFGVWVEFCDVERGSVWVFGAVFWLDCHCGFSVSEGVVGRSQCGGLFVLGNVELGLEGVGVLWCSVVPCCVCSYPVEFCA